MRDNKIIKEENKSKKRHKSSYLLDSDENEDLYLGTSDEERLEAMTEKERQQILYERHMKVKEMKEKAIIEEKLSALENKPVQKEIVKSPPKHVEEVNYSTFCKIIVTRDFILNNIYKPFLRSWVGNVIRFKVENDYFLARIKSYIHEADVYDVTLGKQNMKTDVTFVLDTGIKIFKKCKLLYFSNASPDKSEIDTFLKNNPSFDIKSQLQKFKGLQYQMNKELSENDHLKMLAERRSIYSDPNKRMILRKIKLIKERDEAIEKEKFDLAEEIQKTIDTLVPKSIGKDEEVWKQISERNRKINAQNAKLYEMAKNKSEEE
ncbi:transcription factor [Tubulinosema ratisbonensis]|uniref:Transcription factor n=1 Tax=Tubulinosema ratisbonensis TaxID=291195 RepID=A0A437APJ7_9MICR|nr:transcription factor [Tubulinosema ratisbonensis]